MFRARHLRVEWGGKLRAGVRRACDGSWDCESSRPKREWTDSALMMLKVTCGKGGESGGHHKAGRTEGRVEGVLGVLGTQLVLSGAFHGCIPQRLKNALRPGSLLPSCYTLETGKWGTRSLEAVGPGRVEVQRGRGPVWLTGPGSCVRGRHPSPRRPP